MIFVVLGVGIALQANTYDIGTPTQMGPGFFPLLLGIVLAILGVVGAVSACRGSVPVAIGAWPLAPLLFVTAGLVAFAVLVTTAGSAAAVVCLVVLSCYARLRRRPLEVLVIAVILCAVTYGIFISLLQLPVGLV